ncbi:hypothetical protein ABPG73_020916 [Tetrahymena malaccensis]
MLEGYLQSTQENLCKKCNQDVVDQNLLIYQCPNFSLASNSQACQNTCQSQQYYSQTQNKCIVFCKNGNGKISLDLVGCQTSTSNICVDGFYWDPQNQKCVKNQQAQYVIQYDTSVFLCSNCSLVSDITNCSKVECLTGTKPYYSFLLQKCVTYCGNGKIIDDQQNCQTSSLCIDGYQWSPTSLNCFKNLNPICSSNQVGGYNLKQCSDCSLVSNTLFCTNKCSITINSYYSQQLQRCMIYCRNGVIAEYSGQCTVTSNQCVDGYSWDSQTQKCIQSSGTCNLNINDPSLQICSNCSLVTDTKYCSYNCPDKNLNYYYKQENKCMAYCNNQVIAYSQASCQSSTLCIDGFSWNSQQAKCINNLSSICPALKNSDQYVFVCPNCSLVANISSSQSQNQLCQNSCSNSLLPFWYQKFNNCMFYCGNGLIAQAQENCSSSNTCIDGFIFNSSKGLYNPLSQINQDVSTNQTAVDNLIQKAVIIIGVVVSLIIIIIIVFVKNIIKKYKLIQEKMMQLSTQYQQIRKQQQEPEKQILKDQQEIPNENQQIEINQNDADFNKRNESQDLEEQRQSQQTIYFVMKNDNQFEQPQCSQKQLQQTPQIENITNQ